MRAVLFFSVLVMVSVALRMPEVTQVKEGDTPDDITNMHRDVEDDDDFMKADEDVHEDFISDDFYKQAQKEEGLKESGPPGNAYLLVYPRSWVSKIYEVNKKISAKTRKFNFVGEVDNPAHDGPHRQWVKKFVVERFKDNDFYADTFNKKEHVSMGSFDHSTSWEKNFSNNMHIQGAPFDSSYMTLMAESEFTLAPTGDKPFSYRFLEALFAKSIPIVDNIAFANAERHVAYNSIATHSINLHYHHYVLNDDPNFEYVYNRTWAEENYFMALQHHTLMKDYAELA